ncbi:MAG: undecaprenyl-diphosphatase UppP [Bacilli bacterium]
MYFQIFILGVIQGIAEFLPISSSAHLIIFRDLFGIGVLGQDVNLAFDVALHLGTLLAIVIYFFKDFWNMFIKGITKGPKDKEGKLLWFIIVATIPAAIAGILFEDVIENMIRSNFILIAICLIVMGILIFLFDKFMKEKKSFKEMNFLDALVIGCSQVFALVPGFSRSGTTIAAGRARNLNREDAAKFSFYLSAPVVLGAVILQIFDAETISVVMANLPVFVIGILVAFISGLLCIEFLLKYIKNHDFKLFMWYRIIIGIIVIIVALLK